MLIHCDNEAVVQVVNKGCCKDPDLMHLLRTLFFIAAHYEITVQAVHIAGKENTGADAISRNKMALFFIQAPAADRIPTSIPHPLLDLVIHRRPDWTSQSWSQLFSTFLRQV